MKTQYRPSTHFGIKEITKEEKPPKSAFDVKPVAGLKKEDTQKLEEDDLDVPAFLRKKMGRQ